MRLIVGIQLRRIARRVRESYGVEFRVDDAVPTAIIARCREVESGARNIEAILNRTLLPELSGRILARLADGQEIGSVTVAVGKDSTFRYEIG